MNNDKMRAEFEEWFKLEMTAKGYSDEWVRQMLCTFSEHGNYETGWANIPWQAWQASRAALVVELPASVCRANQYHIEYTGELVTEHDEYYEIEDVKGALDAAGVAYK